MMVGLLHGERTPQSTLQAYQVPAYISKNAPVSEGGSKGEFMFGWEEILLMYTICHWFSLWNAGTLAGKSGEIPEMLKRRRTLICCLTRSPTEREGC